MGMASSSGGLGQEQTEMARLVFIPSLGLLKCVVYKAEKVIHSSFIVLYSTVSIIM